MSAALVLVVPQIWATAESRPVEVGFGPAVVKMRAIVRKEEPTVPVAIAKGPRRLHLVEAQEAAEPVAAPNPELAFYRKYTEASLQRYMKMSMQMGRAPSFLGREMFRGTVTNYQLHGFDDLVIFVHDVAACVARLGMAQQALVRRIALQGYTHEETAVLLRLNPRTVVARYHDALDELTKMFLERKMIDL